jgi:ribosomal protein L37AE/L43A
LSPVNGATGPPTWHVVARVVVGREDELKLKEIEAPGRAVLACRSCGERTVLLGSTDDWYREGRETFSCGGCGRGLTLADRMGEVRTDTAGLHPGSG